MVGWWGWGWSPLYKKTKLGFCKKNTCANRGSETLNNVMSFDSDVTGIRRYYRQ